LIFAWLYRSSSIEVYNGRLDKLAMQILELCAIGLGLPDDTFTKPFNGTAGDCIARMNYYPPCPLSSLTLGLGAHTDPNLLTILSQCKVGGLQVCKNGKWISVKPKPDTLILNIGDTFEVNVSSTNLHKPSGLVDNYSSLWCFFLGGE
jgi:isopenicillin N synthase-like dioxygenase